MSNIYVFDACALIALINDEDGSDKVEIILKEAMDEKAEIYMSTINILEIYYGIYREEGQDKADETYQRIMKQPINIIDVIEEKVLKIAGRIKANYRLSLADSIVLGLAITKSAVVVTSDHHEFDIIEEKEQIAFAWIR